MPLVCHVCERKTSNSWTLEWPAEAASKKAEFPLPKVSSTETSRPSRGFVELSFNHIFAGTCAYPLTYMCVLWNPKKEEKRTPTLWTYLDLSPIQGGGKQASQWMYCDMPAPWSTNTFLMHSDIVPYYTILYPSSLWTAADWREAWWIFLICSKRIAKQRQMQHPIGVTSRPQSCLKETDAKCAQSSEVCASAARLRPCKVISHFLINKFQMRHVRTLTKKNPQGIQMIG